jgi:hypothetical protein
MISRNKFILYAGGGESVGEDFKKFLGWSLFGLVISLGLILSSFIVTSGLVKAKNPNTIVVTGSAKKQITSDRVVWRGSFYNQSPQMTAAYDKLQIDAKKVKEYLISKGISEKDIVLTSINTSNINEIMPNGQYSNKIAEYRLSQDVTISMQDNDANSKNVEKITTISREITELINQGVQFQSNPPQYYYTKIADLKVDMLGKATADAKSRVDQIATSTESKVGALRSANMGVFQITPLYSTEVTDYGINDNSSLEKEITAVVNCTFEIR